jgi:hypothetical protein
MRCLVGVREERFEGSKVDRPDLSVEQLPCQLAMFDKRAKSSPAWPTQSCQQRRDLPPAVSCVPTCRSPRHLARHLPTDRPRLQQRPPPPLPPPARRGLQHPDPNPRPLQPRRPPRASVHLRPPRHRVAHCHWPWRMIRQPRYRRLRWRVHGRRKTLRGS